MTFVFLDLLDADTDVTVEVFARGDLDLSSEFYDIFEEDGELLGRVGDDGAQCSFSYTSNTFTIGQEKFNSQITDEGAYTIVADASSSVNVICNGRDDVFVRLIYTSCFKTAFPTSRPSLFPSDAPSISSQPSLRPSLSTQPSGSPSFQPSLKPSLSPSMVPSRSSSPSLVPSLSVAPSTSVAPTKKEVLLSYQATPGICTPSATDVQSIGCPGGFDLVNCFRNEQTFGPFVVESIRFWLANIPPANLGVSVYSGSPGSGPSTGATTPLYKQDVPSFSLGSNTVVLDTPVLFDSTGWSLERLLITELK